MIRTRRVRLRLVIALGMMCWLGIYSHAKELQLMYTVVETSQHDDVEKEKKSTREPMTHDITVGLSDSYFYVLHDGRQTIYDFRDQQIIGLDTASSRYHRSSLFAIAAFRLADFRKRLRFRQTLAAKDKKKASYFDDRTVATLLGLFPPELRTSPIPFTHDEVEGKRIIHLGDDKDLAAIIEPANDVVLSEGMARMWLRYLVYRCHLHPQVRDALSTVQTVPKHLLFRYQNIALTYTHTLTLKSWAEGKETWRATVAAGTRVYNPDSKLDQLLKRALNDTPKAPTTVEIQDFAKERISAGVAFDAVLAMLEYGLQENRRTGSVWNSVMDAATSDPRALGLFRNLEQSDRARTEQSLKNLTAIDRAGLEKGYVIDIFRANMMQALGQREEAEALYLDVLAHNLAAPTVLRELSKLYHHDMQMADCWKCWEIVRTVAPKHKALEDITRLESKLKREFPAFF